MRWAVGLSAGVALAGVVWVLVFETLLGALLVIGGAGALFVLVLPVALERFTRFLGR